jgi:hypothetical protein
VLRAHALLPPALTLRIARTLTTARTSRSSQDEQAFCEQHQTTLVARGRVEPSLITEETREAAVAFKRDARSAACNHACGVAKGRIGPEQAQRASYQAQSSQYPQWSDLAKGSELGPQPLHALRAA